MFESLADKLQNVFGRLRAKGALTEADVAEAMREVRLGLLEADVNFKVVKDFVGRIRERAVGVGILEGLHPAQQVIKIVDEELTRAAGRRAGSPGVFASPPPTVIMLCGLQGAGKTTHAGKLAQWLRKQGKNPMLVAADIYRPGGDQAASNRWRAGQNAGVHSAPAQSRSRLLVTASLRPTARAMMLSF